jgi:hypothetical protein
MALCVTATGRRSGREAKQVRALHPVVEIPMLEAKI